MSIRYFVDYDTHRILSPMSAGDVERRCALISRDFHRRFPGKLTEVLIHLSLEEYRSAISAGHRPGSATFFETALPAGFRHTAEAMKDNMLHVTISPRASGSRVTIYGGKVGMQIFRNNITVTGMWDADDDSDPKTDIMAISYGEMLYALEAVAYFDLLPALAAHSYDGWFKPHMSWVNEVTSTSHQMINSIVSAVARS